MPRKARVRLGPPAYRKKRGRPSNRTKQIELERQQQESGLPILHLVQGKRRGRPPKSGHIDRGMGVRQIALTQQEADSLYRKQMLADEAFPDMDNRIRRMKRFNVSLSGTKHYVDDGIETNTGKCVSSVLAEDDRSEQTWIRNATEVCQMLSSYRTLYKQISTRKKELARREGRLRRAGAAREEGEDDDEDDDEDEDEDDDDDDNEEEEPEKTQAAEAPAAPRVTAVRTTSPETYEVKFHVKGLGDSGADQKAETGDNNDEDEDDGEEDSNDADPDSDSGNVSDSDDEIVYADNYRTQNLGRRRLLFTLRNVLSDSDGSTG